MRISRKRGSFTFAPVVWVETGDRGSNFSENCDRRTLDCHNLGTRYPEIELPKRSSITHSHVLRLALPRISMRKQCNGLSVLKF